MGFPKQGLEIDEIFKRLERFKSQDLNWKEGRAFSYVYYARPELTELLARAYRIYFSENGLNPMAFPSLREMEIQTVGMCIELFNGNEKSRGMLTSGGTESILMAVKSAKKYARKTRNVQKPEIILPLSAHPAFNKACDYFDIKPVIIPIDENYKVIPKEYEKNVNENTILFVASAPSYPQGVVDPIPEIGLIAQKHHIPFHVDSCVGGFVLPFIKDPSFNNFDLSVPGVTSLSADIHKYGYASKGSSVLLYNDPELRKAQFYIYTDWPGGIYASPSIMGTKPGGAIAVAWTVLNALGRVGYENLVRICMETAQEYRDFIESFEGLNVIGNPDMTLFSFGASDFDIYELGDELQILGWQLDRQQNPASIHMSISPIHAKVFDEFKEDFIIAYAKARKMDLTSLKKKIQQSAFKGIKKILSKKRFDNFQKQAVRNGSNGSKRSAALYGMMGDLRGDGALEDMIIELLDQMIMDRK